MYLQLCFIYIKSWQPEFWLGCRASHSYTYNVKQNLNKLMFCWFKKQYSEISWNPAVCTVSTLDVSGWWKTQVLIKSSFLGCSFYDSINGFTYLLIPSLLAQTLLNTKLNSANIHILQLPLLFLDVYPPSTHYIPASLFRFLSTQWSWHKI